MVHVDLKFKTAKAGCHEADFELILAPTFCFAKAQTRGILAHQLPSS